MALLSAVAMLTPRTEAMPMAPASIEIAIGNTNVEQARCDARTRTAANREQTSRCVVRMPYAC
jgi:hypothetical protein